MNIFKRLFGKKPKKEVNKHRGVPPMNGTWKNDTLTIHFGVNNYQASSKEGAAEGVYDWTNNVIVWKTCRRFPGFDHGVFNQNVKYWFETRRSNPLQKQKGLLLSYNDKLISLYEIL